MYMYEKITIIQDFVHRVGGVDRPPGQGGGGVCPGRRPPDPSGGRGGIVLVREPGHGQVHAFASCSHGPAKRAGPPDELLSCETVEGHQWQMALAVGHGKVRGWKRQSQNMHVLHVPATMLHRGITAPCAPSAAARDQIWQCVCGREGGYALRAG